MNSTSQTKTSDHTDRLINAERHVYAENLRVLREIKESTTHFQKVVQQNHKESVEALHNISNELAHLSLLYKKSRYII